MRRTPSSLLPLLLLAGCGVVGGLECTEIGCLSSVSVALPPLEDDGAIGEIVVEVGDVIATCTIERTATTGQCDDGAVSVVVTAAGLVVDVQGDWEETGTTVSVQVLQDDVEQAMVDTVPAWSVDAPNGVDCPPTCLTATIDARD